jgi:hypothetical protein
MSQPGPLKVVIVSSTFGADGGIEAFVVELARFLRLECEGAVTESRLAG